MADVLGDLHGADAGVGDEMSRLEALLERPLALLLLPLSLLPFLLVVPQMIEARQLYERRHMSGPLAPPRAALTPAQVRRFQPIPSYAGAIPVLAYHGIGADGDPRSVTRRTFAEQMAALDRMGFDTISIDAYARFRAADFTGLPARPLLITFDGGRLDSYRAADRVLAAHGFRAAMFVATEAIERGDAERLTWRELRSMRDSGRWDVEPQAHAGDARVAYDARGDTAPFYSVRRYTRSDGQETFAEFERRVTSDVFRAQDEMHDHGFAPAAFAVPFGDYGQRNAGDPEIAPFMRGLLARQFGAYFVDDERNAPGYTTPLGDAERFEVGAQTTTDRLYMWLRDHRPGRRGAG